MQNSRRYLPIMIVLMMIAAAAVIALVFLNGGGGALAGLSRGSTTPRDDAQLLTVRLSPDGNLAAVDVNGTPASRPNALRMVDTSSGSTKWSVSEGAIDFRNDTYMLGFTSDSSAFIVTGSVEGAAGDVIWYLDAETGDKTAEITLNEGETALAANETYYVVSSGSTVTITNRESGEVYFSHTFRTAPDFARFTPDGGQLLTVHSNSGIRGYDFYLTDLADPQVGDEPAFTGESLAAIDKASPLISGDGKFLAFAIINGRGVFLINLETHQPVFSRFGDQMTSELVSTVRFDALFGFLKDNTVFAYLTNEGILYAVNTANGEIIEQVDLGLGTSPDSLSISANGKTLAVLHRDSLAVWR
ncbi:MAG: PQQ-binding-like beta-propeller repeat protein [Anaerolineaceae bacterium]|nr:PQQ-binding-like beta-propeller repeat protein [Anaerolineaceae bacterium]